MVYLLLTTAKVNKINDFNQLKSFIHRQITLYVSFLSIAIVGTLTMSYFLNSYKIKELRD